MDRYLWKVIYKMAFVIYENRKSRNLEFSQCEEGREIFFQATLLPWGLSDHLACGVTKVHPHPSGDAELGRELRRTQNLTDFNAVKTSAVKWKQRLRGRKTETFGKVGPNQCRLFQATLLQLLWIFTFLKGGWETHTSDRSGLKQGEKHRPVMEAQEGISGAPPAAFLGTCWGLGPTHLPSMSSSQTWRPEEAFLWERAGPDHVH